MNISVPFILRPVATTLLTVAVALAGVLGFSKLPVSPLPAIELPTIWVSATLPGANPQTVATSLAEPLERHLGQIAGVTEMTSQSAIGQVRVTLQFDLSRNIDGAARDVEAAINAARVDLPPNLPSNPIYRKANPADAPILILALTSRTMTQGQMYDTASNILGQRLSELSGIGNVIIGGSTLPAVRVELNPPALYKYGIGLEDVRAALASANANSPKGSIDDQGRRYQLYTNDQAATAADYSPLVVAYRNGQAVRLADVAQVRDAVQDVRNLGLYDGQPAVLLILFRQPNANIIDTIDNVKSALPQLEAAMHADMDVAVAIDRSTTIRASLLDTELTLVAAVLLVILVVFLFLRDPRATLIPAVAVPISILGTFGAMYLLGYSLDVLSLMALTISTGFVVDDAIVVLENISRHIEAGMPRMEAALQGTREVSFTVLSISLSLIAVFIPVLLMGGIVGRLFREFTVTLSIAILVSLVISLTTTPAMCALLLKTRGPPAAARRSLFDRFRNGYGRSLALALRHRGLVLIVFIVTIGLNVALFVIVPKGFFPQQNEGLLIGSLQADQSISFQAMSEKLRRMVEIVRADPAVASVVGYTGVGSGGGFSQINVGNLFISLKPVSERVSADQVIERLRPELAQVPGGRLYLVSAQDLRSGGRQGKAQYQYTLQSENPQELDDWTPKLVDALAHSAVVTDVNSDQQQRGLEAYVDIDRDTAARLGVSPRQIANTLYDAFGQRQVSTIYAPINQYHVVMEVDPRYAQYAGTLRDVYVATTGGSPAGTAVTNAPNGTVSTSTKARTSGAATNSASSAVTLASGAGSQASRSSSASTTAAAADANTARNSFTNALANTGHGSTSAGAAVSTSMETMVPLAAISSLRPGHTALSVNHQGPFIASTISFNLKPGKTLGEATREIDAAIARLHMPASIHGMPAGTAQVFGQSASKEPILILAALATVYIVLGVLYESYVHPITILSTLPSAGVGALLALLLFKTQFDIIGLIAVILLMGIVKKNAILMVDFAIEAKRSRNMSAHDAILAAGTLRLRPILMTTAAAILGALPLALSFGTGGEVRRPLGIAIVGGLIISQFLTLYTTPVLYLYLDRLSEWAGRVRRRMWRLARRGRGV